MSKVLICPRCKRVFSDNGIEERYCPDCHRPLIQTDIDETEWKSLSREQREIEKNRYGQEIVEISSYALDSMANDIWQIKHDFHVIYIIICVIVALIVIGIVVGLALLFTTLHRLTQLNPGVFPGVS